MEGLKRPCSFPISPHTVPLFSAVFCLPDRFPPLNTDEQCLGALNIAIQHCHRPLHLICWMLTASLEGALHSSTHRKISVNAGLAAGSKERWCIAIPQERKDGLGFHSLSNHTYYFFFFFILLLLDPIFKSKPQDPCLSGGLGCCHSHTYNKRITANIEWVLHIWQALFNCHKTERRK